MRVIAGALKGRRLARPRWTGLRPTSDRLRETLFNVLGERVAGARVLDGFAGTGAIGIEALSRGASHVTFVERDRRGTALIAENLRRCEVAEGYAIIRAEVGRLEPSPAVGGAFDVIVLDPPYEGSDLDEIVTHIGQMLTREGVLILEHAKRRRVPVEPRGLRRFRVVSSGDSQLSLYARATPSEEPPGHGHE